MTTQSFHYPEPMIPSDSEVELARNSSRVLAGLSLKKTKTIDISLETGNHHQSSVTLPLSAFKLLVTILTQMAEGNGKREISPSGHKLRNMVLLAAF